MRKFKRVQIRKDIRKFKSSGSVKSLARSILSRVILFRWLVHARDTFLCAREVSQTVEPFRQLRVHALSTLAATRNVARTISQPRLRAYNTRRARGYIRLVRIRPSKVVIRNRASRVIREAIVNDWLGVGRRRRGEKKNDCDESERRYACSVSASGVC